MSSCFVVARSRKNTTPDAAAEQAKARTNSKNVLISNTMLRKDSEDSEKLTGGLFLPFLTLARLAKKQARS